jgi:ABC-type multidrug transport system fused ATPase/permease subunit
LGSKFSMVVQYTSTFVAGLIVGLADNWRLTLVILLVAPILIGTSGYMAKVFKIKF